METENLEIFCPACKLGKLYLETTQRSVSHSCTGEGGQPLPVLTQFKIVRCDCYGCDFSCLPETVDLIREGNEISPELCHLDVAEYKGEPV